ncbi:hypothetical protein BKA58DRAFT_400898 [Alternaria rosae]|uniref:uncharacterized protein n=1 Tax=Alternaria rosae TaxID=1187941 RepID=UPI001E8DE80D|nr:uncharacterized protein BKA58DRAFT_400898 [Alternaria rosae]KAH6872695.1 hypothetical protein BKA58DRAFT_400898 [Alternaria rosae]
MTQPGDAQAFLSSLEPLECAICLEGYDTSHPPIMLGCRHIFGENCLRDWVEAGTSTCPNCRAPLFGEESAAPPSEQVQLPPVELPTDVVREEPVVPTSQEIPQLPMEVLADFIREASMVRWSQEPQQRRVQVSTDVMHVIARQSAWDVLTGVMLGLLRRNGADDPSNVARPRKRLQRNAELHPQAQETRRIDDEAPRAGNNRGDTHLVTHEPIDRTCMPWLNDRHDRQPSRSRWQALRDRATPSRIRRKRQEDQDREYAERLQRTYYEQDGAYETYDNLEEVPPPTYSIRGGVPRTREPPSDAYIPQRFRNAGLNGLYDSIYKFY